MNNVLTPQQSLTDSYRKKTLPPEKFRAFESAIEKLMSKPLDSVNKSTGEANVEDYVRDF